jgi:hypothetical protein
MGEKCFVFGGKYIKCNLSTALRKEPNKQVVPNDRSPGPCVTFRNSLVLQWDVVNPRLTPKVKNTLPGCPSPLIQYIRSYPLYLVALTSSENQRTRHAVVTKDTYSMGINIYRLNIVYS